ncbi:hypothetical protein VPH35_090420 [Triticum aestivum]|nr:uncharacterized protein LOC123114814 [Triticum aestivum]
MIFDPSSPEKKIIDCSTSTTLLCETPSGFAIVSCDELDPKIPVEDIWAYPPQNVRLVSFKKFEEKSSAIDLAKEIIYNELSEMLTEFCGPEQKLLVGRAEYKRIIERKLGITRQYDNIVEEVIWVLENIMHTLLPEETSEPKEYRRFNGKGLILFLRQYGFLVKNDWVTESIVETARRLYHFELDERQYLDSLCSKIQKSVDLSSLTKDWSSLKFATALKFLVYPRQSYEVWKPSKILSASEFVSIKSMRQQYRETIMSEINVLSVYKDVSALYYEKRLEILADINLLLPLRPKVIKLWNSRFLRKLGSTDSPAGSKVGKEAIIGVDTDAKQTSAAENIGETEKKNGTEESGAKAVKAAENLENFEPPQTADASNEMTARPTRETSGDGMKAVDIAGESRQNGQVFPLGGHKSKELDFPETEPDVTCDEQAGDTDAKQTSAAQIMGVRLRKRMALKNLMQRQ